MAKWFLNSLCTFYKDYLLFLYIYIKCQKAIVFSNFISKISMLLLFFVIYIYIYIYIFLENSCYLSRISH